MTNHNPNKEERTIIMTMFNQPQASGGYFDSKNHVGSLVLVTQVHEVYHNSMNVYQGKPAPRDEAKIDIVDLSQDGQLRERVIATHPGIVNRLSTGATNILGRITQEPTQDGQNYYYALQGYDEADVPVATQWVQQWQAGQMKQPAQQAQSAPQSAPQGQSGPQGGYGSQSPQGAPQGGYGQQQPAQAPYGQGGPQGHPGYQQNGPQAGGPNPWDQQGGGGYGQEPPF